jgi:creatinine amidohydrolase/Fe(II)-dependent formamide hydrolase-like protein
VCELETLSGPALRALIERGRTTVVVPFGSIEDQRGHLPTGADSLLADAVGREVASRLDAILAPTVRVGCAGRHRHRGGTLTLRAATLTEVAVELGESLAQHAFRMIVLCSTHGGNAAPLLAAAARLNRSLQGVVACAPEGDVGPDSGAHSGKWLTSVLLTLRPDLVEIERAGSDLQAELRSASAQRGRDHLERFIASIVDAVQSTPAAP